MVAGAPWQWLSDQSRQWRLRRRRAGDAGYFPVVAFRVGSAHARAGLISDQAIAADRSECRSAGFHNLFAQIDIQRFFSSFVAASSSFSQ